MTAETDRRRLRGQQRRRALVDATLRLVAREGAAAVTHRAVAREAAVPLAATTYYFATLDDLLVAGLTAAVEDMAGDLRAWGGRLTSETDLPAALAELIARLATGGRRSKNLACYELYLLAARRKALLPVADASVQALVDVVRPWVEDDESARAFVAAFDGLLLEALMTRPAPTAADLRPLTARLLR